MNEADTPAEPGTGAEAAAATLPLQGLYLHLVRAGFALSVRDYNDALTALKHGHGAGRRDRLQWLVTTLWARGDLEVARIEALFRRFPVPTPDDISALGGQPAAAAHDDASPAASPASPPAAPPAAAATAPAPLLRFGAAGSTGGGLPSLRHQRPPARRYAFEARPPVSQRVLTIAWRRLRRAQRSGPKTELDIDATIAERCRSGWLAAPTLVAARRNQARLLVLLDASASMEPWRALNRLVDASLPAGMLASARLLYFDNDPRRGLYQADRLAGFVPFDTLLHDEAGAALLLIGDAGAARGRLDPDRVAGTLDLLRRSRGAWPAAAWLNPMPARRWAGSSAQPIAREPGCPMFEFSEDGLTRAVDALRGSGSGSRD